MLLCVDIGNTNIKLGLFTGDQMRFHWRISTDRERLTDEYAMLLLNLIIGTAGYPGNKRLRHFFGCPNVNPGVCRTFTALSKGRTFYIRPGIHDRNEGEHRLPE